MIRLTDEEIDKAIKKQQYYADTQVGNSWLRDRAIATAQLKKVVEEIEKRYGTGVERRHTAKAIIILPQDWQALKKEIEDAG